MLVSAAGLKYGHPSVARQLQASQSGNTAVLVLNKQIGLSRAPAAGVEARSFICIHMEFPGCTA